MAAILKITPETGTPFEVPLENTATIGRTPENSIAFASSPLVSRQHAIIRCHNGYEYQIMDLGSRNGTYVDGQRVVLPVTLHDTAVIRVGGNELVFESVEAPAASEYGEVTMAASTDFGASRTHPVAILVCDIRGFSTFSEKLPASTMAQVLGKWFRESGNLVQRSGGIIDKFIGDALLAYWMQQPQAGTECVLALDVAERLLDAAAKLRWPESELPFQIGIALHHGPVSSGNIGLVAQRDATIIGDTVNTAFRLETVMKQIGQSVILSEAFASCLPDKSRLEDYGEKSLKGKTQAVRVFGLNPKNST